MTFKASDSGLFTSGSSYGYMAVALEASRRSPARFDRPSSKLPAERCRCCGGVTGVEEKETGQGRVASYFWGLQNLSPGPRVSKLPGQGPSGLELTLTGRHKSGRQSLVGSCFPGLVGMTDL